MSWLPDHRPSPAIWARCHLRLAALRIPFDYFSPAELISVAASVAVAAVLALGYLRMREPRVIRGLRAMHTGSANDYATYAIAGTLAAVAVLSLG